MNFAATKCIFVMLILYLCVSERPCAPLPTDGSTLSAAKVKRQIPETKKDIFVSRGWGAGGMPFSVLYMSPHSSKAPLQPEPLYQAAPLSSRPVARPIELPSRPYIKSRRQYSVIPQLFVSYGWGPMGKK